MKINSELGYEPVTYSELTDDEEFWKGCKACVNYDILMSKERKNCICTAMLYDPADHYEPEETAEDFKVNSKLYERFMKVKQSRLLKVLKKKDGIRRNKVKLKSFCNFFFNLTNFHNIIQIKYSLHVKIKLFLVSAVGWIHLFV